MRGMGWGQARAREISRGILTWGQGLGPVASHGGSSKGQGSVLSFGRLDPDPGKKGAEEGPGREKELGH